jgi:hypothetical protein
MSKHRPKTARKIFGNLGLTVLPYAIQEEIEEEEPVLVVAGEAVDYDGHGQGHDEDAA